MKRKTSQLDYGAPKLTMDEFLSSGAKLNRTGVEFLRTDLETLLIFTNIAMSTDNWEERTRNRQAARKAYDSILRFLKKVNLSGNDARFFSKNLRRLKSDLQMLGETF
jgi:hypothetical protein